MIFYLLVTIWAYCMKLRNFSQKNFEMKDLRNASFVLDIQMLQDCSQGIFWLSQKSYIKKVLNRFNMKDCSSPVGSLLYAQVCTRPGIAFIVGMLGRYMNNPGVDHWKAAKRFMWYFKRIKDFMLTYRRSDSLEIIGHSDSYFSRCQDSKRSTSGYVFMLAGGVISWRSTKKTLIASSTMAVKFIACYEASNHGIWLRNFVIGLCVVKGIK